MPLLNRISQRLAFDIKIMLLRTVPYEQDGLQIRQLRQ